MKKLSGSLSGRLRRGGLLLLTGLTAWLFLKLFTETGGPPPSGIAEFYLSRFIADTASENAVAAIYLNYRVFDTLFETLTLLVSVIGVIHFSVHREKPEE